MKISGKTKICGLIGNPVKHSLSPIFQNAAFQYLGLEYVYAVFLVKREDLRDAISGIRSMGFHGLNITMPFKIEVINYIDELDETAKNVNAVNTILNKDGRLIGYTTDGIGALNALKYNGINPSDKKVVILGSGGAAKSIAFTLAKMTKELVILNRTLERAEKLAEDLLELPECNREIRAGQLYSKNVGIELRNTNILINATSLGMYPQNEIIPINPEVLHSGLTVFDLIYKPVETRLLREAKKRNAKIINGLSMLVHQGAASFRIWTKMKAPIEVMVKATMKKFAESNTFEEEEKE